jgi:hypothetical protein
MPLLCGTEHPSWADPVAVGGVVAAVAVGAAIVVPALRRR